MKKPKRYTDFEHAYKRVIDNKDIQVIYCEFSANKKTLAETLSIFLPVIAALMIEKLISLEFIPVVLTSMVFLMTVFEVLFTAKRRKKFRMTVRIKSESSSGNLANAVYIFENFDLLDNPIDDFFELEYKEELKWRFAKKFAKEKGIKYR